jgi:hypothetical protein
LNLWATKGRGDLAHLQPDRIKVHTKASDQREEVVQALL